jgi:hypothetical protein
MPEIVNCLNGGGGGAAIQYPLSWVLFHRYSLVTVGNALVVNHNAGQDFAHECVQGPGQNGDTFTQAFYLAAGNYVLNVLGTTEPGSGILTWWIDGVLAVAAQDWYTVGVVQNVVKTANVTVVGNGQHVLKGIVDGQNVLSGGFNIYLTAMALV